MKPSSAVILGIFTLCVSVGRADEEQKEEGFKAKFPTDIAETKTFKKFIQLVDEEKLNITVFISNGENHRNDNLKRLVALGVTFITNRDHVVEAEDGTKPKVQDFMKIAEGEKLSAGGTRHIRGEDEIKSLTNNPHGMVRPKGYEIQFGIKDGKTGVQVDDEDNVAAQYTFRTPDGKTTKVLYARAKVEAVHTSNLDEEEILIIETILPAAHLMYEEEDVPKAVATVMDKLSPKSNWQVIDTADESSHLDATKWGIFKMADNEYTVFSI